jgi:hypothetical protein
MTLQMSPLVCRYETISSRSSVGSDKRVGAMMMMKEVVIEAGRGRGGERYVWGNNPLNFRARLVAGLNHDPSRGVWLPHNLGPRMIPNS